MNRQEWLECNDPASMLDHCKGSITNRRLRLFAVACCRCVWALLTDPRSRHAVEVAERFADGLATDTERHEVHQQSHGAWGDFDNPAGACWYASHPSMTYAVSRIVAHPYKNFPTPNQLANLIRSLIGDPFQPVSGHTKGMGRIYDPEWIGDPTVHALAEATYQERDVEGRECPTCKGWGKVFVASDTDAFVADDVVCDTCHGSGRVHHGSLDPARLAMLSDALEEAGIGEVRCWYCNGSGLGQLGDGRCGICNGTGLIPHPILAHLRSPGPHWRGDWAVDLCLGKE